MARNAPGQICQRPEPGAGRNTQPVDLGQHRHCRIACSRRSIRSLSWRTAPRSSESTIRCSRCSSFCSMSQFMWAGRYVFLPG
jgi:hypothetical protein